MVIVQTSVYGGKQSTESFVISYVEKVLCRQQEIISPPNLVLILIAKCVLLTTVTLVKRAQCTCVKGDKEDLFLHNLIIENLKYYYLVIRRKNFHQFHMIY